MLMFYFGYHVSHLMSLLAISEHDSVNYYTCTLCFVVSCMLKLECGNVFVLHQHTYSVLLSAVISNTAVIQVYMCLIIWPAKLSSGCCPRT